MEYMSQANPVTVAKAKAQVSPPDPTSGLNWDARYPGLTSWDIGAGKVYVLNSLTQEGAIIYPDSPGECFYHPLPGGLYDCIRMLTFSGQWKACPLPELARFPCLTHPRAAVIRSAVARLETMDASGRMVSSYATQRIGHP